MSSSSSSEYFKAGAIKQAIGHIHYDHLLHWKGSLLKNAKHFLMPLTILQSVVNHIFSYIQFL
jgi:hypothetical protein